MKIVICDTETTGLDKPIKVTEVAAIRCSLLNPTPESPMWQLKPEAEFATLVNPLREINEEAQRVTGITNEMVKGAPTLNLAMANLLDAMGLVRNEASLWLGHNFTRFDMNLIGKHVPANAEVGCTLKAAKQFIPDAERHSLDHLRQHCELPSNGAHRALADCQDTIALINHMLSFGTAWGVLEAVLCQRMTAMPWGKHKGKPLANMEANYLRWVRDEAEATTWELRRAVSEVLEDME